MLESTILAISERLAVFDHRLRTEAEVEMALATEYRFVLVNLGDANYWIDRVDPT